MSFKIELAKSADMLDLFELANDDAVRKNSFNQEKIEIENHKKWFAEKLNDKNCVFYVARFNGEFCGYIRFDKAENNEFVVTIHLVEKFRGKGFGSLIIREATAQIITQKNPVCLAFVKKENEGSLQSFLKAGYKLIDENLEKNGFKCYLLEYRK